MLYDSLLEMVKNDSGIYDINHCENYVLKEDLYKYMAKK